jgi:hypothetical protein
MRAVRARIAMGPATMTMVDRAMRERGEALQQQQCRVVCLVCGRSVLLRKSGTMRRHLAGVVGSDHCFGVDWRRAA